MAQLTDDPSAHLLAPAGRTKLLSHGERRPFAFVLLHGLTASPTQFTRFADELFARGHNVLVPRLPHHGHADRMTTALHALREHELRAVAHESVMAARGLGERVIVAGFSLGGLLAIWIAQHEPVERAVAIAPFLGISWVPNRWMTPITDLALRVPNAFVWWDPFLREKLLPEHGYPRYASHALARSYRLAREVIDDAERLALRTQKLILVTNRREMAVNNRAVRRLATRIQSHAGSSVELVDLRDLPPSHDIVEPLRHPELADRVYPQLLSLIEGSRSE